ncbi:M24 family metallopeptidase [Halolamina salifodinae]|uniref:Xaa-Pro aminopeptidase n=1 Tax=Halolamina salifodinae TaxID=1202767 RepID=A0A8T4GV85_9EURY|nr:aminopeptidase P family protein [Halolamina salifodinae]MBP1986816.1 Xaa-Pro aminopeptidase [Halolamina salifodinae]
MASHSNSDRVTRLFGTLPGNVDVVALSPGETLRYFTGLKMHKSERPTLVFLFRDGSPVVVHPELEGDRIEESLPDAERYTYEDATDPVIAAQGAFERLTDERTIPEPIGAEFRSTRLLEREVFAPDGEEVVDVENAVAAVRSRKDDGEIERMRTAVEIIEGIFQDVFELIEPGMTEIDIETEIKKRVMESDADAYGVGIVTSGERTAHAHANTGSRAVEDGDLVMIDAGVIYEGYYSDITRTVAVGEPESELVEIYNVVQEAAAAARDCVEPGVEFQEIDRAARTVIEDAGYGEYFPHRVGHGLGLEGHEPPYLVEGNDGTLEPGHAVTVEPGIYVPGLGGVRIEDDVVVTEDGSAVLSTSSRDLRIL